MKRKVCKIGPSSLVISLPSKWVKRTGLKKGDEVDVEEKDSQLVVSKGLVKSEKGVEIRLTEESERYIRSWIGRLYRHGFSKINVLYDQPEVIARIKNAVGNLIGADIIDTEVNRCTIKIFPMDDLEVNFDKNLVKMLITLKSMFQIVKEDIEKGKFNNVDMLNEFRHNNWKIKDFIMRNAALQNMGYENFSDLCHITFCYEKIGTKLFGFYKRYLAKTKVSNINKLVPLFEKIHKYLDWYIKRAEKNEPISLSDETRFRHDILDFNVYLLNELHNDKKIDHSFLTISYFVTELLDSTVSYFEAYKGGT